MTETKTIPWNTEDHLETAPHGPAPTLLQAGIIPSFGKRFIIEREGCADLFASRCAPTGENARRLSRLSQRPYRAARWRRTRCGFQSARAGWSCCYFRQALPRIRVQYHPSEHHDYASQTQVVRLISRFRCVVNF